MKNILTLSEIARGKVDKTFNRELKNVINNILDDSTGLSTREINIKVKLKPNDIDDREKLSITVETTSKLAPAEKVEAKYVARKRYDGSIEIEEYRPGEAKGQMTLDAVTGEILDRPRFIYDGTSRKD